MKSIVKVYLAGIVLLFSCLATAKERVVDIQTFTTTKGVPVYLVERNELPMVDVAVIFNTGSSRDGQQPGRAALTGKMLSLGAAKRNADAIAQGFENVGAQFNAAVGRDFTVLTLRTLTDPDALQPAFAIFQDVLTQPTFPAEQFQRLQKQVLQGLQLRKQSASTVAQDLFYQHLYPTGPYRYPVSGTTESVKKISLPDLTAFYQQHFVTGNAKVVIVGHVDLTAAKKLAEQLTQALRPGHRPKATLSKTATPLAQNIHENFPGPQTAIIFGQLGIQRDDPHYYVLEVGNAILGGIPFYSRLFSEVREKQGLSYSVYSDFNPMKQIGPFNILLQTQNKTAMQAIKVTQDTVNQFISKGPNADELTMAKKNIQGSFPLSFASNANILQQIIGLAAYDLPLDYFDAYQEHINQVTQTQIQQAFKAVLSTDHWLLVRVGAA